MKYYLTFKTPDVTDQIMDNEFLSPRDKEILAKMFKQYLEYNECATLCFDTDKQTVTVENS